AGRVGEGAEDGLEGATALVDEVQLVGATVAYQPARLGAEGGHREADVVVPGQPGTAGELVVAGGELAERAEEVVAKGRVGCWPRRGGEGFDLGHLRGPGGGVAVVEDRVGAAEAVGADDLLRQQLAALGTERDVALAGDLTQAVVTGRHGPMVRPIPSPNRQAGDETEGELRRHCE